jgi:hypothetical protein
VADLNRWAKQSDLMNSIITPGRAREEARQIIELEVRRRYEEGMKSSRWWRRCLVALKIQREVAVELNRRFPPHALYMKFSAQ